LQIKKECYSNSYARKKWQPKMLKVIMTGKFVCAVVKIAHALNVEIYQLVYPKTEADKLFPIRLPADILLELRSNLEKDMAHRFDNVLTDIK
jgi:hypothetical protein